MKHDKFKEWIQLAILDEIEADQRRLLDQHLEECAECRTEFEELRHVMTVVGESRAAEPTEQMLREARRRLRETIAQEAVPVDERLAKEPVASLWRRLTQGMARSGIRHTASPTFSTIGRVGWLRGYRVALAGVTAVAVGFLAGYLAFGRMAPQPEGVASQGIATESVAETGQELGPTSYANVRFVDVDPRSGQVKLEYDIVRPVRLRADIEDERVQRMLAYTVLNEENPGVKIQAIQTIDAYVESPEDEQVKTALIQALKTDPSPGVRKHALYVLYKMPFDQAVKDACLYVLANDENPGMRIAAINVLAAATLEGHLPGKEVYDALRAQGSEDDYIRIRSGAFMEEVNGNVE
ncbi:MAG: HEAT repeat domain-containing protein [Candidatus Latescibacterota bacterium]|nr:MAG: HEAT repeat domain-containing protein [Candidatus Latescibacterota bacterium]